MVTKKAAGKKTGKLKLKKETVKNLDVKKSENVKGGIMSGACQGPKLSTGCSNVAACKLREG